LTATQNAVNLGIMQRLLTGFILLFITIHLNGQQITPQQFFARHGLDAALYNAGQSPNKHQTLLTLLAIKQSFTGQIEAIGHDHNDYFLQFRNGEVLFYANGRMLPYRIKDNYQNFRAFINYRFNPILRDPSTFTQEEINRLLRHTEQSNQLNLPIFDDNYIRLIYGGSTRQAISPFIVRTSFLGFTFYTHRLLVMPLLEVERQIRELAQHDNEVQNFISSLNSAASFVWRTIRGQRNLSWHALGIAVDILPRNRNQVIYWGWERARNPNNWPTVPLSERWMPPSAVIEAFESMGFVWGGKWPMYDNMHFEFRPELHRLYQLEQEFTQATGFQINR